MTGSQTSSRGLEFGVYPLSAAGTPDGLAVGPADDFDLVAVVLADLGADVVPRTYLVDTEPGGEQAVLNLAERYRSHGLLGHATLGCLRESSFDLGRWDTLVRTIVRQFGADLRSLQVTNEPNLSFMDGSRPFVIDALVRGVLAAKDEARRLNLPMDIGFGSVPQSAVTMPTFWDDLAARGGSAFIDSVDFVGHNFYVDVFEEPLDLEAIERRVRRCSRDLREPTLRESVFPPRFRSASPRTGGRPGPIPSSSSHEPNNDSPRSSPRSSGPCTASRSR